jgi:hypothetical protein
MWADGSTSSFRAETNSYGIPPEYSGAMQTYGVSNPVMVRRYFDLGISPRGTAHFVDTEKPNAVAIFPMDDDKGAFYTQEFVDLLAQLGQEYDLFTAVVADEDAALSAARTVPNVSLLVIAGHGTKDSLALGASDPADVEWTPAQERKYLDTTDVPLYRELRDKLSPDATILLLSCSTGEGRGTAHNLANSIHEVTRRRVIAADRQINLIQIVQLQPIFARLSGCALSIGPGPHCWDATYEPK